jgi:DNA-binding CsgD family transcriptional regulator
MPMEFSRNTFMAFSEALSVLYSKSDGETRIESFLSAVRDVFTGCNVITSTNDIGPHSDKDGTPGNISLPIRGTRLFLVISNPQGAGPHEQFLADRLRIHLQAAFSQARKKVPRAPKAPDAHRARALGLTRRECEVLHWLMIGKRDAEIAAEIGAAPRTVNKHVENILSKLGVETRGGAVHVAAERLPRLPDTT